MGRQDTGVPVTALWLIYSQDPGALMRENQDPAGKAGMADILGHAPEIFCLGFTSHRHKHE